MRKMILTLFVVASAYAEYWGSCAPSTGAYINGEFVPGEPVFFKSWCPTQDDLTQGILRYLEATNQLNRSYAIEEMEHWYMLHFTD